MEHVSSPFPLRRQNEHLTFYEGHYVAAVMHSRSRSEVETLFRPFMESLVDVGDSELDQLTQWFLANGTRRDRDMAYHLEVPYPSIAWALWDSRVKQGVEHHVDPRFLGGLSYSSGGWNFGFVVPIRVLWREGSDGVGLDGFRINAADRVEFGYFEASPSDAEVTAGFRQLTRDFGIHDALVLSVHREPSYICS